MLVQLKRSDSADVHGPSGLFGRSVAAVRRFADSIPLIPYARRNAELFASPAWIPDSLGREVRRFKPDVIHLHWIARGYIRIESLAHLRSPIVWTLHDMWPFTGGCHYDDGCEGYTQHCGQCPQLGSDRRFDLSHNILLRKARAWSTVDMTFVAPSRWIANCARRSSLLSDRQIVIIPNGIDTKTFIPRDKGAARRGLALSPDRRLILFGAMNATRDPRKGFNYLREASKLLKASDRATNYEIVVFGDTGGDAQAETGLPCQLLGRVADEDRLATILSAADLLVVPSTQDNLPNTALEALACGLPCVAFDIGGMRDIVQHKVTGYVARAFDIEDFANGIAWVLADDNRWRDLSRQARKRAAALFDIDATASKYISLYQEVVARARESHNGRSAGGKKP